MLQAPQKFLRESAGAPVPSHRNMNRPPIRQHFTQSLYPVGEANLPGTKLLDPTHDLNGVVVTGRSHITHMSFDNGEQVTLLLEPGIGGSRRPHKVSPEHLEPDEVSGVVGHPHLVGFGVTHPEAGPYSAALDGDAFRPRVRMLERVPGLGCITLPYTHFGALMTTRRIYHEDPEVHTFVALVGSCRPGPEGLVDVVLDQTAFYPTGGGQPHDTGLLAGYLVVDVFEHEGEIVHRLRGDAVAGQIEGTVDWERRRDHRQQHTGQHILSRAFLSVDGAATVGFHLGQETCTIDLDRELVEAVVEKAERLANDVVMADQPIADTWYEDASRLPSGLRKDPDLDGPIRIVSIGDFDATPCGGTHCGRSGQVGLIKILGTERRRGGLRIEFVCGYRALLDFRRRHHALRSAARLLSTEDMRLPERVRGLLDELKEQRTRLESAETAMREKWLETLIAESPGPLARVLGDAQPDWLGPMATSLADARKAPVLLAARAGDEARVVMAVPEGSRVHAGRFLKELLGEVGGKGGGAERSGQGKLPEGALSDLMEKWKHRVS